MSEFAIRASGLSKQYCIGRREPYHTLRESLMRWVRTPWRAFADGACETVWALRDLSFEVREGEVLGIVGRNGAGKSTLLKVLSRITEPTAGEADIRGRVGSLLEVGTGFHFELTGRENIFLNGAILGMKRQEIRRKFDAIVAFADVETFLDTPVKHYSSGMYMRLAFAVAAHLDPEILIIDEVLAVGDAAFQDRCLGKMGEVARSGRTVLFVSHNANAVRSLCTRVLLLNQGRVEADGEPTEILARYERESRVMRIDAQTAVHDRRFRRGSGQVRFTSIAVVDDAGEARHAFRPGENIRFELAYECREAVPAVSVAVAVHRPEGEGFITDVLHRIHETAVPSGTRGNVTVELPSNVFRPGEYPLYFWLGRNSNDPYDVVDGLTEPLVIFASRDGVELEYDPSNPSGYVSIPSRIVRT
jgi:lipopolysaccharide transport system ATP-binding protein